MVRAPWQWDMARVLACEASHQYTRYHDHQMHQTLMSTVCVYPARALIASESRERAVLMMTWCAQMRRHYVTPVWTQGVGNQHVQRDGVEEQQGGLQLLLQ